MTAEADRQHYETGLRKMEETVRRCDALVGRTNKQPHGVQIDDGQPTTFQVGGKQYTADLCDEHRAALVQAVQPYIDIARRSGSVAPRNAKGRAMMRAKGGALFTTKDVRKWLKEQDIAVPDSGRIPNADIEKYKQAHNIA